MDSEGTSLAGGQNPHCGRGSPEIQARTECRGAPFIIQDSRVGGLIYVVLQREEFLEWGTLILISGAETEGT